MAKAALPRGLNPQQLDAVATTEGNLLILAGAGTGKTRVVTERIGYLLRRGVLPENILAVTFTNKAAGEMKERVAKVAGRSCKKSELSKMIISTFHSLCVRILRRDCEELGYRQGFSIFDQGEQLGLVRKAAKNVRGSAGVKPDDLLYEIGKLKNAGISPIEFSRQATEQWEMTLSSIYRRYQESLKLMNAFDFDDLLLKTIELFRKSESSIRYWRERFRYIMVDEFQDTNTVQLALIEQLATKGGNLCVVGDDDQSIYGWRGAVADNILNFHNRFANTKVIRLEQNYRSVSTVLKAANAVIKNNEDRREKALWSQLGEGEKIRVLVAEDQEDEALRIADEIKRKVSRDNYKPSDFAIIIRTNSQTRPLEQELGSNRLPYTVIGGQSFFDNKEVKDVLAYLSVIANPRADAPLLRIINTPARGIGDRTVELLSQYAVQNGISLGKALSQAVKIEGLAAKSLECCKIFADQLASWRRTVKSGKFHNITEEIIEAVDYKAEIEHVYDDPLQQASRYNFALDVGASMRGYLQAEPEADLADFLAEAALWGKSDDKDKDKSANSVKIITAHSAKGLEFPVVYIAGVEEGLIPHKTSEAEDNVSEERRLFYVAITRAQRELTLTYCKDRVLRGKKKQCEHSRFIDEIPGELLDRRDSTVSQEEQSSAVQDMLARWAALDE